MSAGVRVPGWLATLPERLLGERSDELLGEPGGEIDRDPVDQPVVNLA
jgi:hypothetical protein